MSTHTLHTPNNLSGDIWGGFAAMLVVLPSAIAFGVTIFSPLGAEFGAKGALAGMLGVAALGLIAATFGGTQRLISAPCAPAAAAPRGPRRRPCWGYRAVSGRGRSARR